MKILITGANGFLGSNILRSLIKKNYEICILTRKSSNFSRINDLLDKVIVCYYTDLENLHFSADLVIHFAWQGVSADDRNNIETQIKNLSILKNLLFYCKSNSVKRIIGIGSQAEYGFYEKIVDENHSLDFDSHAYGTVKNLCRYYIKNFCESNNIGWTWLRLFSFYGPDEDPNWFIPWLILNVLNENNIDMTEGNQRYAYMHVNDFTSLFLEIIKSKKTIDKIYNVCSENDKSLKQIALIIKKIIKPKSFNINFGVKPYRKNQIMFMKGNISKLLNDLGIDSLNEKPIEKNLSKIIQKFKNEI